MTNLFSFTYNRVFHLALFLWMNTLLVACVQAPDVSPQNRFVPDALSPTDYVAWVHKHSNAKANPQTVNLVFEEAQSQGLNPLLVLSVIHTESNFKEDVCSSYGACGLMQVVPRLHKINSPFSPKENVHVGTKLLSSLIKKRGSERSGLASYNGVVVDSPAHLRYMRKVNKAYASLVTYRNEVLTTRYKAQYATKQTASAKQTPPS